MSNATLRTIYFASDLPRCVADALNHESGRIYTGVLVEQYRIYRKKGLWLSGGAQERYNDFLNADTPRLLHAHSIDAAQQGFPKAVKTAQAVQKLDPEARYPHKRKRFRTTVWKGRNGTKDGKILTSLRQAGDNLLLPMARGQKALELKLPEPLRRVPVEAFTEVRLVYNKSSRHYEWHVVVDDGNDVQPTTNTNTAAIDLGEIHPATLTDGVEACVVSCRELRSVAQHTNKRTAKFQVAQARHKQGSRRWKQLQRKKNRFLAKQELRRRDIEHKASRAAVEWAVENQVGTLAIGDVRDVAKGKRLNRKSQQKVSNWSHGRMRKFIGYKAKAVGITVVDDVDEAYTSQTCAICSNRYKPKGRLYRCPSCGSIVHRDVQGAANLLSRHLYAELAKVSVPTPRYRHPVLRGKRSPGGHPASCSWVAQ
jgi:putative transposase